MYRQAVSIPNVRSRLTILFSQPEPPPAPENQPAQAAIVAPPAAVGELQQLQLVIANTGERAISFIESPALDMPLGTIVLDASIIHQNPNDLGAQFEVLPVSDNGIQRIRLSSKLLNKREHFVVKLLLSNYVDVNDLRLHLLADDLPRSVPIKPLPPDATKTPLEAIAWGGVGAGTLMCLSALGLYFVIDNAYSTHPLPRFSEVGFEGFIEGNT